MSEWLESRTLENNVNLSPTIEAEQCVQNLDPLRTEGL